MRVHVLMNGGVAVHVTVGMDVNTVMMLVLVIVAVMMVGAIVLMRVCMPVGLRMPRFPDTVVQHPGPYGDDGHAGYGTEDLRDPFGNDEAKQK